VNKAKSQSTGASLMTDRKQRTRARACPGCGKRIDITPNPYYGVGQAVHEYIAVCSHCEYFAFVRGIPPEDAAAEPDPPRRRFEALRRWMGR
jgi:hypothetical protein